MNRSKFNAYKQNFVDYTRKILSEKKTRILDEAAFPAYSHKNPLMSFLFWERIWKVMTYIEKLDGLNGSNGSNGLNGLSCMSVLDFGCGSGVMLPFLSERFHKVVAADIDLSPLKLMSSHINFNNNVTTFNLQQESLDSLSSTRFDFVLALDVLEHVENLSDTLSMISNLIVPAGKIIISGPTESFIYKSGRKIAGKEFSGEYHTRNIYDIKRELASFTKVTEIATLFYPFPLFRIYCGTVGGAANG